MKRLVMLLVLALGLAACGGGSSSTPTPAGTSVDLTSFKRVFLGSSAGAQYSFPALFGSDSQGRSWSGSFTVVADGPTTFEGLSVTKRRTLVTLQLAGGTAVSGTSTSYFRVSDGSFYKSISSSGVINTPVSQVPIPATLTVGSFGTFIELSGSDGTTTTSTYTLNPELDGASILVLSSTVKTGATITGTETDSFYLNAFGVPTKIAISVTTSGVTVNLSGSSI